MCIFCRKRRIKGCYNFIMEEKYKNIIIEAKKTISVKFATKVTEEQLEFIKRNNFLPQKLYMEANGWLYVAGYGDVDYKVYDDKENIIMDFYNKKC